MAEQQLNGADVSTGFEQMYSERMTQQMRGDRFGNPAAAPSLLTGLFYRILADGLPRPIAREEPLDRAFHPPPRPEQL